MNKFPVVIVEQISMQKSLQSGFYRVC